MTHTNTQTHKPKHGASKSAHNDSERFWTHFECPDDNPTFFFCEIIQPSQRQFSGDVKPKPSAATPITYSGVRKPAHNNPERFWAEFGMLRRRSETFGL